MHHAAHKPRLSSFSRRRIFGTGALAAIAGLVIAALPGLAGADPAAVNRYHQENLVSDIPGVARITDLHLVNPWGLSASPSSPLWVSDNGTNVSTLYTGGVNGSIPSKVPLVVRIPGGAPTGTVFNSDPNPNDFVVQLGQQTGPAFFFFASETGHITAWNPDVSRTVAKTEYSSPTAVYKGLTQGSVGPATYLYAANFHDNSIDVFDRKFHKVSLAGNFTDPSIPAGFAPFNVQLLNGNLYVSYAMQDADKHDDVKGPGNGFVDIYDTSGNLITSLISHGALNSPWGLALAPAGFGPFSGKLLVGNFGDGTIHAYNPTRPNTPAGELRNDDGNPITINGLWALRFGNGTFGSPQQLVFTAGIADESHGLLGELTATG